MLLRHNGSLSHGEGVGLGSYKSLNVGNGCFFVKGKVSLDAVYGRVAGMGIIGPFP